ncbi:ribonuclease H-like domain-containing protein [Tanacetum coccineum]
MFIQSFIECQIVDNCKKGLGYENYNVVPPPYTGNFMPPTPDLSFTGLDKFVNKPIVENCKAMSSEEERKVNYQNFAKKTQPCAKRNLVPRAVLMTSGLVSINTARQNISKTAILVNTARQVNVAYSKTTVNAARPMSYLSKTAHSTVKRPIHKNTSFKNSNINQKGNPQMDLQDQGVIDNRCSRHMTRNMSYLIDYEEIDGGYVAFGGNPKGGKITGKGTIKTGNLNFENVYFVRELKFNLFSVSQMCDKKNNVLFNDTECIVLSPNFKLIDESQVLLRVLRKNNMYSVDLKNIVPKGGLTFIFVKATSDESKLWHRRLENLVDHKVKVIRCDNGTEFKNIEMNQFCEMKGILRQFSVARTPQQNRVVERSKFDGKADEGFFVGYSLNSKAFRVLNSRTRIVEKNLHIRFSESTPNVVGTKASDNAGQARKETEPVKNYMLATKWHVDLAYSQDLKETSNDGFPNPQVMMK